MSPLALSRFWPAECLSSRPAGDRKARAGGRRSAPSLPRREAGNGHRDGRAPQQCPSRAANGSLRWTNGAKGGFIHGMKTPLQQAQQEWEDNTTHHPKEHFYENGKKQGTDPFRKYGHAIAWLEWDSKSIVIKKIEKLPCAGRGAASSLINFLKSLADKYQIRIWGNPIRYDPDPPVPCGPLLTQDQLEAWYEKHGFQIRKIQNFGFPIMGYPDAPK